MDIKVERILSNNCPLFFNGMFNSRAYLNVKDLLQTFICSDTYCTHSKTALNKKYICTNLAISVIKYNKTNIYINHIKA